jgi:hypothetical protein
MKRESLFIRRCPAEICWDCYTLISHGTSVIFSISDRTDNNMPEPNSLFAKEIGKLRELRERSLLGGGKERID